VYINDVLLKKLETVQDVDLEAPLYIGGRPDDVFFRGTIDDVRIFGSALSSDEVATLYQQELKESGPHLQKLAKD
jgi:hypothetical protein